MIITESEIEIYALDLLKELNGYQVVYRSELAERLCDECCPAVRAASVLAGSVRAGCVGSDSVGASSVRAGSEPAPTPTNAATTAIHEYPEPARTPTNDCALNAIDITPSVGAGSEPAPTPGKGF